jgi:hypothetical protein
MTSYLPIERYLIELLHAMAAENCVIVIAGGLGIYLKHRRVVHEMEHAQRKGLFDPLPLPDARATDDIDAFLSLDVFMMPMRASFRGVLARLGYTPRTDYYQFKKQMTPDSSLEVLLDLLAPHEERDGIKTKPPRIGPADNQDFPPDLRLHAHVTPEAFAIDHGLQELELSGRTPDGQEFNGFVRIPHRSPRSA